MPRAPYSRASEPQWPGSAGGEPSSGGVTECEFWGIKELVYGKYNEDEWRGREREKGNKKKRERMKERDRQKIKRRER